MKQSYGVNYFESDLGKVRSGIYNGLMVDSCYQPSEEWLRYRYNYIKLLVMFRTNQIEKLQTMANAFYDTVREYLQGWTELFFDPGIDSPPFDFILLCAMTTNGKYPPTEPLFGVLAHCNQMLKVLERFDPERQVRLCDSATEVNRIFKAKEIVPIIQNRIVFTKELICSSLSQSGNIEGCLTFMKSQCSPTDTFPERSKLFFGQCAIVCGDHVTARQYLDGVNDVQLKKVKDGTIAFIEGKFQEAKSVFPSEDQKKPSACAMYMGEFEYDAFQNQRKPTIESRIRWPLPPL